MTCMSWFPHTETVGRDGIELNADIRMLAVGYASGKVIFNCVNLFPCVHAVHRVAVALVSLLPPCTSFVYISDIRQCLHSRLLFMLFVFVVDEQNRAASAKTHAHHPTALVVHFQNSFKEMSLLRIYFYDIGMM